MSGEKLPMFMIGKSQKLSCFMGIKDFPIENTFQIKSEPRALVESRSGITFLTIVGVIDLIK